MVRFLGHGVEILHLPQLKQSNSCFFGKKEKRNPEGETPALVIFENYWTKILTSLYSSGSFKSCPCRRQNQDWVCVSLRKGGGIGCKTSKVRARSDGLSGPPDHPRSPPYRDFDVSCKTSQTRKRLTPWPEGWVFAQSPVWQDVSGRPRSFWFGQANNSGRWGQERQYSNIRHSGS